MKKLFLAIILLICVINLNSQTNDELLLNKYNYLNSHPEILNTIKETKPDSLVKTSLGFSFGLNRSFFELKANDLFEIKPKYHIGFQLNLIVNYKLNKNFYLRASPGILFTQRDIFINDLTSNERNYEIESILGSVSFQLKTVFIKNNYILLGVSPTYDFSGNVIENWIPIKSMLKKYDFLFQIGYGINFKKISIEINFNFSPYNIYLKNDNEDVFVGGQPYFNCWNNGIKTLNSSIFTFNILF